MCGRYVISLTLDQLADLFETPDRPNFAANYNAAPTQTLPVVRLGKAGEMRLSLVRWGLVPHWSKTGPDGSKPLINARAETAAEKPTFRTALKRRRALVPADGFYEWGKAEDGAKQPWYITRSDGEPFVFAGLWERWGEGEAQVDSFAILTVDAGPDIAAFHHRCPVIVERKDFDRWLDPGADPQGFFEVQERGRLSAHKVSSRVNRVRENDAGLITPMDGA
jgi:putative SOS response-associated peptidase YedK